MDFFNRPARAVINNTHRREARRLMAKYGTTACLKAMYRAKAPDDFYDLVATAIVRLEKKAA